MNCSQFQEHVFDYLDETLSPAERAAAAAHLDQCPDCRAALRRHQQFAATISTRLRQRAENITLDATAQRRIAAALNTAASRPIPFWLRFALPIAATAAIAGIVSFAALHSLTKTSPPDTARIAKTAVPPAVVVNVSYCVPIYTFHRENNLVIDALTCDPQTATETSLAKN